MFLNWLKPNTIQAPHIIGLKTLIHVVSLYLLISTYYLALTGDIGGDPVQTLTHFTGIGAFNLLILTLCVSPLARYLRQGQLLRVRRLIGLYAFVYAACHLYVYVAYDLIYDWTLLVNEIIDRPYITVGFSALLILLALTVTSLPALMRKMGKRWKHLHNLIYVAAILVGIHFLWSVKSDIVEPTLYLGIVAALLVLRYEKLARYWRR